MLNGPFNSSNSVDCIKSMQITTTLPRDIKNVSIHDIMYYFKRLLPDVSVKCDR